MTAERSSTIKPKYRKTTDGWMVSTNLNRTCWWVMQSDDVVAIKFDLPPGSNALCLTAKNARKMARHLKRAARRARHGKV